MDNELSTGELEDRNSETVTSSRMDEVVQLKPVVTDQGVISSTTSQTADVIIQQSSQISSESSDIISTCQLPTQENVLIEQSNQITSEDQPGDNLTQSCDDDMVIEQSDEVTSEETMQTVGADPKICVVTSGSFSNQVTSGEALSSNLNGSGADRENFLQAQCAYTEKGISITQSNEKEDVSVISQEVKSEKNKSKASDSPTINNSDKNFDTPNETLIPKKESSVPMEEDVDNSEKSDFQALKDAELDCYWQPVLNNSEDFSSWTDLLDYVEKQKDLSKMRTAYDQFLSHYPYCYGYWKKYADVEHSMGNSESCKNVYERGVKAIGLSVDLWTAYLDWAQITLYADPEYPVKMRSLYERSIVAAGLDFRSDSLWEHYIDWESRLKHLREVTAIYDRLLLTPTQSYYQNWENFKRHIEENDPKETMSEAEYLELRPRNDSVDTESETPVELTKKEKTAMGIIFIERREQSAYQTTYAEITKRWNFEENIRRPYFHVRPLEFSQLSNWNDYLDLEIAEGNEARIRVLFERCLIACALYEQMWIRYARYLEMTLGDLEDTRDVWRRACKVHIPMKPSIHWYWSMFEERYDQETGSYNPRLPVKILEDLEAKLPNNVILVTRKVDALRRCGAESSEVIASLEEAIARFEEDKQSSAVSHLTGKLARYLYRTLGDYSRAVSMIKKAIENDGRNERLFNQLLDMAYSQQPIDVDNFCHVVAMATESSLLPGATKLAFCKRKLQFLEEFDTDISRLSAAYAEYEWMSKAVLTADDLLANETALRGCIDALETDTSTSNKQQEVDLRYTAGFYDPLMQVPPPPPPPATICSTIVGGQTVDSGAAEMATAGDMMHSSSMSAVGANVDQDLAASEHQDASHMGQHDYQIYNNSTGYNAWDPYANYYNQMSYSNYPMHPVGAPPPPPPPLPMTR